MEKKRKEKRREKKRKDRRGREERKIAREGRAARGENYRGGRPRLLTNRATWGERGKGMPRRFGMPGQGTGRGRRRQEEEEKKKKGMAVAERDEKGRKSERERERGRERQFFKHEFASPPRTSVFYTVEGMFSSFSRALHPCVPPSHSTVPPSF